MAYKRISPIPIIEGGTNATSFTTTDGTIYYDGTRLVTTVTGTSGQVLTSNGVGVAPTYQTLAGASITITGDTGGALTSGSFTFTGGTTGLSFGGAGSTETLSGTLVVSNGGTGRATLTNHGVLVGAGTVAITQLAVGTNGQILVGASAADPSWVTPTAGSGLTITTNSTTLSYAITAPVSIANGGTNATSFGTTDGTVYFDGTRLVTTATGTSGQILTSGGAGVAPTYQSPAASSISITGDSGGALTGNSFTFTGGTTGLSFGGAGSTETVSGTLVVANGGTGRATLTNHGVLVGAATTAITQLAVGTNGQVLVAATGADPAFATLTSSGATITFTLGANTLNLEAVASSSFTWTVITANQTAAVNNGYICNKAGTLALALPATAAVGSIIEVTGINTATGWQITQASGQQIFFGTSSTTSGATGTLTSSAIRDSIRMVCVVANTTYNVISSIGNITVV